MAGTCDKALLSTIKCKGCVYVLVMMTCMCKHSQLMFLFE